MIFIYVYFFCRLLVFLKLQKLVALYEKIIVWFFLLINVEFLGEAQAQESVSYLEKTV